MAEELGAPVARLTCDGRCSEVTWLRGRLYAAGSVVAPERVLEWDRDGCVEWATVDTRAWLEGLEASSAALRPKRAFSGGWLGAFSVMLILSTSVLAYIRLTMDTSPGPAEMIASVMGLPFLPFFFVGLIGCSVQLSRRPVADRTLGQLVWGWIIAAGGAFLALSAVVTAGQTVWEVLRQSGPMFSVSPDPFGPVYVLGMMLFQALIGVAIGLGVGLVTVRGGLGLSWPRIRRVGAQQAHRAVSRTVD